MSREPITELDARFSAPGAVATPWAVGRRRLETAELYWISTVRPDGRPHVTPLIGVWRDDALHVSTGPDERKARNLAENARCALTTGTNTLREGLDVVVEGTAERVTDDAVLRELATAWEAKYASDWHFDVQGGAFRGAGGEALVFAVRPARILGFAKSPYAQTRWRFDAG